MAPALLMADAAELVVHGGPILTMEVSQPRAQAIAIAGGPVVAVGAKADVMAHLGPGTSRSIWRAAKASFASTCCR